MSTTPLTEPATTEGGDEGGEGGYDEVGDEGDEGGYDEGDEGGYDEGGDETATMMDPARTTLTYSKVLQVFLSSDAPQWNAR